MLHVELDRQVSDSRDAAFYQRHICFKLRNLVLSVAGAGIGQAVVEEFAKLGARVFTCARDEKTLDEAIARFKSHGYAVDGCSADVTNSDDVKELVAKAIDSFGGAHPLQLSWKTIIDPQTTSFQHARDTILKVDRLCV